MLHHWKILGITATIIIILAVPFYLLKREHPGESVQETGKTSAAAFVGSEKCKDCHLPEYDKWKTSHHKMAMTAADENTVLGDFDNTVFDRFGINSRFYRKNGRYFVSTRGPQGKIADFEIAYTFGWYPLQQYLVPFPGGRLQCLPIAWDVPKQQWYQLPPDRLLDPDDWLFWTNGGQNWNGMCAECHSTELKKNYGVDTGTYHTTWSEISVGCEACHGPGSRHVSWAEMPEMGRPRMPNDELTVKTSGLSSRQQIELCAPCHARRMSLGNNTHTHTDFLDYGIPQLLGEEYYFTDGQILEEVYVYGSFSQSKMYERDVRCSDCHDVHSIKRIQNGNDLCLQCHKAAVYDTKNHHFHKKNGETGEPVKNAAGEVLFEVGSGAQCEQCHMPGRIYMGADYRPDHSFRIPRPDLSAAMGVPNTCNRCHADKTDQWSLDAMAKWYGQKKRPHYGTILDAGRKGLPAARDDLIRLVDDRLYPTIVRATALFLLSSYEGAECAQTFERALTDEEALVRQTALRHLAQPDLHRRLQLVGPLLYDPVKAVRIEAANLLAGIPPAQMTPALREKHRTVLTEYRQAMEYGADFASSRHNLGNLYTSLGQRDKAIEQYRKAIEIDNLFYPAKVNLAMLYNQMNRNDEAEKLLREAAVEYPVQYQIQYSLGLLLAERKKYAQAISFMQSASRGLPQRPRIHYNLGLLFQQLHQDAQARLSLEKALEIEPANLEFLYALADFYVKRANWEEARNIADRMVAGHPDQKIGHDLKAFIDGQTKTMHQ